MKTMLTIGEYYFSIVPISSLLSPQLLQYIHVCLCTVYQIFFLYRTHYRERLAARSRPVAEQTTPDTRTTRRHPAPPA